MKIFITIFFILFFTAGSWAQDTIKLTTKIWPPYQYYDPSTGDLIGVSIKAVKCAFTKMNKAVEITILPWKRAQKYVETGMADGFFSASRNSARDEFAILSASIAEQNWAWYVLRDNKPFPTDPAFRKNAIVAASLGSNMLTWLKSENYRVTTPPPDSKSMLKMLSQKRFDAFMENEMVMDRLIDETNLDGSIIKFIERKMPVGIYFSKITLAKNPELMDRFNSAVKGCKN